MTQRSRQTQELKDWLEANKFGQFFEKMYESGVETLDDLRVLQTESEVMELAGPSGINMGVVFRRKFIRAVLSLSGSKMAATPADDTPNDKTPLVNNTTTSNELAIEKSPSVVVDTPADETPSATSPRDNKSKGLTRPEQQALNELVSTIKGHTHQLRTARDDLSNVKKQADEARQKITDVFDKAMGVLLMRRKQLENALNLAETETTENLKQRVIDFQASAKNLLKCKQTIEEQFKTAPSGSERQQLVTNLVDSSLRACPPNEKGRVSIIFDQGDTPLIGFLENYGTVGVGRQKIVQEANQET